MDWEEKYKEETGREATYKQQDKLNASRVDVIYYHMYVCWLEDLLDNILKIVSSRIVEE